MPRVRGKGGRTVIARSSHRPARRTPTAVALARRLTEDETLEQLRLTPDQVAFLDRCAEGRPPRNAAAAISAIKLKLEYSQPKPKQEHEHSGSIEVTKIERVIVDPKP